MTAEYEHINEEHTAEHAKNPQQPLLANSFCRKHFSPSEQDVTCVTSCSQYWRFFFSTKFKRIQEQNLEQEPSYQIFKAILLIYLTALLPAMKVQWCSRLPPQATYRKEKETTLISARGNQALSQRRTLSVIKITSPHPCNCSSKLAVSAA